MSDESTMPPPVSPAGLEPTSTGEQSSVTAEGRGVAQSGPDAAETRKPQARTLGGSASPADLEAAEAAIRLVFDAQAEWGDMGRQALEAAYTALDALLAVVASERERANRAEHFIECADTPLMRDVLAERDAAVAALAAEKARADEVERQHNAVMAGIREHGISDRSVEPWRDDEYRAWEVRLERTVECPSCAFTFGADHTTHRGNNVYEGYSCPNCEVEDLEAVAVRLREALQLTVEALENHGEWCGFYHASPGNPIYHRALASARAALVPVAAPPEREA